MTVRQTGLQGWLLAACLIAAAGCGDDDDAEACTSDCETETRDAAATRADAGDRGRDGGGSAADAGQSDLGSGGSSSNADAGAHDAAAEPAPPVMDASADAGPDATDAGAMMEPPPSLPMDGDQLSLCSKSSDCDMGLGCYDVGPGQGFCTAKCERDADCMDLEGADYSCSAEGLCEVDCRGGPPGAEKCPAGLLCMQVSGPGPGGIQNRCKYSASVGTDGNAFSACSLPADCDDGLQCIGALLTIPGYCTHPCMVAKDCKARPRSGAVTPSCELDTCVLNCAEDPDGCPDGMTCVETPLFSQCAYQQ